MLFTKDINMPITKQKMIPFPAKGGPIVFMNQPTHYIQMPDERLAEWEATVIARLGIRGVKIEVPSNAKGVKTVSLSGSGDKQQFDDSDWEEI
jgi:hypothetical protein